MTIKSDNGQSHGAVRGLPGIAGEMEPLIERLHENADHLCELMDSSFLGFEQRRLKSVGFLIRLMKEDALKLYGLYTQATKTET
ncbi:MAG: hypothetical protein PVF65_10160 [Sphingomonadales bacterium]|jgi:hypothetical protein